MSAPANRPERATAGWPRTHRLALWVFFGSVAVNAALGIVALAGVGLGGVGGRLLGTSLSVTGALVLALLCLPAHERRLLRPVPAVASAVGAVAFALLVVGIWTDEPDDLGRVNATLFTLAVAGALASLAALARPGARRMPARSAAYGLLALAAALMLVSIWAEIDSDWYGRAIGVVVVALAAVLVSLPVLHRLGTPAERQAAERADEVRHCPYCGADSPRAEGDLHRCGRCDRAFVVTPAR